MRHFCMYGSVRGAVGNHRPYRNQLGRLPVRKNSGAEPTRQGAFPFTSQSLAFFGSGHSSRWP